MLKLVTVTYNIFDKNWEVTKHYDGYKFIHPYNKKMVAMKEAFRIQLETDVSVWVYTKDYSKKEIYPA